VVRFDILMVMITKCKICFLLFTFLLFDLAFGIQSEQDTLRLEFNNTTKSSPGFIPYKSLKRPKVGIALSGGGARGLAQIGVLQVLEEHNVPIDYIVGVSMGAIVGGLYAAGYTPAQLQDIVKNINWDELIIDKPPRTSLFVGQKEERDRPIFQIRFKDFKPVLPQSITVGQKLSSILSDLTMRVTYHSSSNFDKLKIPFRALTCDLVTGKKTILQDGDLAEALRASATFPLLFSPVQRDSMLLVDGGLINNIPVDEVQESGVDIVIAVNTTSKLHSREKLKAPWIIADQVTTIMQREKKKEQEDKADVLIKFEGDQYKSDDFTHIDSLIHLGRKLTLSKIDQLKYLIEQQQKNSFPEKKIAIKNYAFCGCSPLIESQITEKIEPLLKQDMTLFEFYRILETVYEIGIFSEAFAVFSSDSIFFHIQENPIFQTIVISGNTVFPDSVILSKISSDINQPINYYQSEQDLQGIIDLYRQNGYSLANIKNVSLINDTLTIHIDEGVISDIKIQGNYRTKNYVILREFPLKHGDIFNIDKATEGINNIHSTDLFTNVSFEIQRIPNSVNVIIKLLEKPFLLLRMSARYDLERKGKGFIEIVDENILGSGNLLIFHGQYGARSHSLNLQFRADRIFHTFLTYRVNIFYDSFEEYIYSDGNKIGEFQNINNGISFSIGRQIKRLGTLSITSQVKSTEIRSISGLGYPIEKMELKNIAIQSIVDTQDKYPFPTKGKYYQFFYAVSSATFLNSQKSFFKIFSSLESFFTILKRNTLHPKVVWGTSDLTTPFAEQFRLGGLSSFYGLHDNEYFGCHLFLSSLEYRYLFPFRIGFDVYWSVRFDIGATWNNALDIKPEDIEQGFGTSLSVQTFLGPIMVAYGCNSEGRQMVYFSAGYQF